MAVERRARSTRLLVISLLVASLTTITIDFRAGEKGPLAAIGRVALGVVTPLQEAISGVFRPMGTFFSTLANLGKLRAENARLRAELQKVTAERAQFAALRRENATLRLNQDLKERAKFETRGATVIGESISNFEWAIIVDRGADDNITLDTPVLSHEGLVGRVVKVSATSSKVMLITDPDSRVGVKLAVSGERGIVVGRRGGQDLRLDLVDPDTEVRPGEVVTTSGFTGTVFPADIIVGVVSEILPSDIDLSKHVLIRPAVDFSRLEHVLMVVPRRDVGELGQ